MQEEQSTWTLDDSARASNPGELKVQRMHWLKSYPTWPLIWFSTLAIFSILAIFLHWVFWIPAVLMLIMNWLYWRRVSDHFCYGCANPGVVLSLDPMLIAVSTDLTMGGGEYPVIKIIEKELTSVCGKPPKVGSIVPTIALYKPNMNPEQTHWSDFDPRPVDCATTDLEEVQRVINSFTPEDLNELKTWLKQVPRPFQPGLYPIIKPI